MAELDTSSSGGGKHKGGKRSKKMSTRVDLTAMVDLGFLLITFFMMTTTLKKPKTMELNMPDKDPITTDPMPIKASLTTSFVLAPGDTLYYWSGLGTEPNNKVKITNYSGGGLRKIVLERQKEVHVQFPDKDLIVLLKPMDKSVYKNIVDFLDEMSITDTKTYAIVDITAQDKKLIKENLDTGK